MTYYQLYIIWPEEERMLLKVRCVLHVLENVGIFWGAALLVLLYFFF